jgi:hypothetical protein
MPESLEDRLPYSVTATALVQDILANRQKASRAYWRDLGRVTRGVKAATADPEEKNSLWSLHTFAEATGIYLEAYRLMSRGKYLAGWCKLEDAELGFERLARNVFAPDLLPLIETRADLVTLWQSVFPYRHFISPAMRYKKWDCSICGKQSTPVEPCGHIPNLVYAGELCYRHIRDFEPLEVSIVTDPVQKYSVLQLDYDYSVVKYVLDHLSGPFHQWSGQWTHKRHGHDRFSDRPAKGPCPCDSGLRYEECCLLSEGVRLPHFQMAVTSGTRMGPLADKLVLRRPSPQRAQGEAGVFRATLLRARG